MKSPEMSSAPEQLKSMNLNISNLWKYVLTAVITAMVVGGGVYFLQQRLIIQKDVVTEGKSIEITSEPISTDQIEYEHKNLRLSFKYPDTMTEPEVEMVKNPEERLDIAHISLYDKASKEAWDVCEDCADGGPDFIVISLYKNPDKLTPKEWVIKNSNAPYINYDSQGFESMHVGGHEAVRYSGYGLGGSDAVVFYDEKSGLIYNLMANYMNYSSTIRGDLWYVMASFSIKKSSG